MEGKISIGKSVNQGVVREKMGQKLTITGAVDGIHGIQRGK